MPLEHRNYDPAEMQGAHSRLALDAITTDRGVHISSAGGILSGSGRILFVNSTVGTATSAVLNEFRSSATDETIVLQVQAVDVLAAGVVLDVLAGTATTAQLIQASGADGLTTGRIANFASNSTSTATRSLVRIVNDSGLSSGVSPLEIQQDATLAAIRLSGAPVKGIDLSAIGGTGYMIVGTATSDAPLGGTLAYLKVLVGGTNRYIALYS